MKRNYWVEIIAALFILLFVYTGTSKILDMRNFRIVAHDSPLIRSFSNYVVWALPITEFIIALLLFFPRSRRLGLWASFGIMLLFTAYVVYMVYFSRILPCSCGGIIQKMTWKQHIVFNAIFTLLAVIALWLDRRKKIQNSLNPTVGIKYYNVKAG